MASLFPLWTIVTYTIKALSSQELAVKRSGLDGFGDMSGLDVLLTGEVGDGARDLELYTLLL